MGRLVQRQPVILAVGGGIPQARLDRLGRVAGLDRPACNLDGAFGDAVQAKAGLREVALAAANQPGNADNLARAHGQ